MEDEGSQVRGLAALAPYLEAELLAQGVVISQQMEDEEYKAWALEALAPYLNGEQLVQALETAYKIRNTTWQAQALAGLAPHLKDDLAAKGLAALCDIENLWQHTEALIALFPCLKGDLLSRGIEAARSIKYVPTRAEVLIALIPHLEGEIKHRILMEGLEATLEIDCDTYRVKALSALVLQMMHSPSTNTSSLRRVQRELIQCFWRYRDRKSVDLLNLLVEDEAAFLRAFDLSQESYARIAQSIIDICTKWEWL
jgi:hypothetical protein